MIALVSRELDHHAEAVAAMHKAIAATCPAERLRWLRVAMAWNAIARLAEEKTAA
jgi:hypothetical protein